MDIGVVGDFVGEVSASASSLWLGSVSDSSRTDTSEPGEQGALTASTARCGPALAAPHFPTAPCPTPELQPRHHTTAM